MPYVLTYTASIEWMAAGLGLGQSAGVTGTDSDSPGPATAGPNAQVLEFFPLVIPTSTTFTNTDVANLLTAMLNDLTTQMEVAATQTRIQNFSSGGG